MERIQLDHPVEVCGVKVDALTMRRPRVSDQLAAEKMVNCTEGEREVRLFANLCEVPPATIEGLDLADYRKLQKAWTGFLS